MEGENQKKINRKDSHLGMRETKRRDQEETHNGFNSPGHVLILKQGTHSQV